MSSLSHRLKNMVFQMLCSRLYLISASELLILYMLAGNRPERERERAGFILVYLYYLKLKITRFHQF